MFEMRTFLLLIVTGVLILVGQATAAERPASAADLDKLQEQVRTLDKDVAILKEGTSARLEAQDKRLSDVGLTTAQQANHIAAVSNQTSWISILVGLITVVIPIAMYFNAKKAAKEEAEKWFEDHSAALRKKIDELEQHARNSRTEMDRTNAEVQAHAAQTTEEIKEAANKVLSKPASSNSDQTPPDIDEETKAVLESANRELTQKPEATFTAADHYTRGAALFEKRNYQSALDSFEAALAKSPDAASYLLAKGVTLGKLKRHDDAIAVYDDIVSRFSSDPNPAIREWVAKALVNKGLNLGALNRHDDAIAVYDDIVSRFSSDPTPAIRGQVANALVNKVVSLAKLKRYADAIKLNNKIIQDFSNSGEIITATAVFTAELNREDILKEVATSNDHEEIIKVYEIHREYSESSGDRSSVAMCQYWATLLNVTAFHRIMLAKERWANEQERGDLLTHACADLRRGLEMCADANKAMLLGNLGYALFLSGQRDEARQRTLECLQLGKEPQLEAQRDDAQQHRIEPEDSDYEALLTEVWEVVSSQKNSKKP